MGGTMRLGIYPAHQAPGSLVAEHYGAEVVHERHRHRYEVNNAYRQTLEDAGLICSGLSPDGRLVEFVELPRDVHPFFVATQAHPEFLSRPTRPHPLFSGLAAAAIERSRAVPAAEQSPLQTAQRELLEETGYRASQWHTLLDYFSSPGYSTERIRIFLARGVEQGADNGYKREQEEKYIVADWVPLAAAVRLALSGKLHNGPAIAGVLAGYAASSEEFSGLRPATATDT